VSSTSWNDDDKLGGNVPPPKIADATASLFLPFLLAKE
jgi:hypothetical protein